jgi:hypothetical protein
MTGAATVDDLTVDMDLIDESRTVNMASSLWEVRTVTVDVGLKDEFKRLESVVWRIQYYVEGQVGRP